jgi:FixJ family two-component response regulator
MLMSGLIDRFGSEITCVATVSDGREEDTRRAHDVIITELELADGGGLELARHLTDRRRASVVLLGEAPTPSAVLEAMRLGVRDMLVKPFRVHELLDAVERILMADETRSARHREMQRLRRLLRRLLRERRELRQRTELICRDLVGAHRRLVDRVLTIQGRR